MIRLLIWEPHEILQMGLRIVLSEESDIEIAGFVVSAEEAMAALTRLEPQLLLLDETCDRDVIQAACSAGVHTIVFSSSSAPSDIADALSAGANAYILKGTSVGLLLSAIRAVAAGASWLDPIIAKRTLQAIADGRGLQVRTEVKCPAYDNLTEREIEVLSLLSRGLSNDSIAKTLFLSRETVKTHVRHVMEKLQARSRTEAAIQGIKLGLGNEHPTPRLKKPSLPR